ncbi:MAG: DUF1285 domain-containing protein [Kiloniellales bacterium]
MTSAPPDAAVLAKWLRAGTARSATPPGGPQDADRASCGEFDMRIAVDGTWFYHGSPIGRKSLVRLFSKVLYRDEEGAYWLVTPVEQGRIRVDDAPFTAVEVEADGEGEERVLRFRTNLDEWVEADAEHPIRAAHDAATGEPRPYVLIRGRLEALILRPVFYQLIELGETRRLGGEARFGVCSKGRFFPLDQAGRRR